MKRRVIVCCAARNELHNLSRLIPTWKLFADEIIVADQRSDDGSRIFLDRIEGVHVLDNPETEYNESSRSRLLTDKARSLSREAALVFLDADETLSANVVDSEEWRSFLDSEQGTTGFFPWVTLWGSCRRYIRDGRIGGPAPAAFAFIDDGRPVEGTRVIHGPRGPGLALPTRRFYFNEVVALHFFGTNPQVYLKKQIWYKMYWIEKGGRYFHTNRNHCLYEKIRHEDTDNVPGRWIEGFAARGIDVSSVTSPELMWYDVEVLKYFCRHGSRRLWLADIWIQDWEYLRKLALEKGYRNIPDRPIERPPRWITFYTNLTLGRVTARGAVRSLTRLLKRKILP